MISDDNSASAAEKIPEGKGTLSSEMADHPKHLVKTVQGSYVVGGSPVGWNFLVWLGGKIMYYGLAKDVFADAPRCKLRCCPSN